MAAAFGNARTMPVRPAPPKPHRCRIPETQTGVHKRGYAWMGNRHHHDRCPEGANLRFRTLYRSRETKPTQQAGRDTGASCRAVRKAFGVGFSHILHFFIWSRPRGIPLSRSACERRLQALSGADTFQSSGERRSSPQSAACLRSRSEFRKPTPGFASCP
jgi:hypothetical protein